MSPGPATTRRPPTRNLIRPASTVKDSSCGQLGPEQGTEPDADGGQQAGSDDVAKPVPDQRGVADGHVIAAGGAEDQPDAERYDVSDQAEHGSSTGARDHLGGQDPPSPRRREIGQRGRGVPELAAGNRHPHDRGQHQGPHACGDHGNQTGRDGGRRRGFLARRAADGACAVRGTYGEGGARPGGSGCEARRFGVRGPAVRGARPGGSGARPGGSGRGAVQGAGAGGPERGARGPGRGARGPGRGARGPGRGGGSK